MQKPPQPPVPGVNPGKNQKFKFEIPPPILAMAAGGAEGGFDPAQLTLILRPEKFPGIKPIAWQVFTIDGRKPSFSATLPLDRGFGDVKIEEDPNTIGGILHARHDQCTRFVPPGWLMAVDYDDGILSFSEPSSFSKKRPNHIAIENRSEVVQNFTLGTFHMTHDEGEDDRPFQPFAMIESVKKKLVVPHALDLQIYLTYHARVGQVMTDEQLKTPLLRPVEGIKVAELAPVRLHFFQNDL
ncbi:hypothetical protein AX14_008694 [Amanita brunnescens Koide BX004]|nr:hypothetical protein AX14_008694 [Amanita brunnescens Koide BX004]